MLALSYGEGPRSYWIFEPTDPTPSKPAPVVVLLHGWMSTNPGLYGAWIAHLTRRGNIVIYPRYQQDWTTRPAEFLPNALDAIRKALVVLDTAPGRTRPDRDRFALIGHSAGGNLAAQLAAMADEVGLPEPRALVTVLPGEVLPSSEPSLDQIPSSTALVVIAAQEDMVVGDERARAIFQATTSIPMHHKQYIFLRSDRSAVPALVADHAAATASLSWLDTGEGPFHSMQMNLATVDRLDTSIIWPAADLAMEAGFSGLRLDQLTLAGARFQHLGHREDGLPIRPPLVSNTLASIPRVTLANGVRLVRWPTSVFNPISRPIVQLNSRRDEPTRVPLTDAAGPIPPDDQVIQAASEGRGGVLR
jgi:dienelactone hydrolase